MSEEDDWAQALHDAIGNACRTSPIAVVVVDEWGMCHIKGQGGISIAVVSKSFWRLLEAHPDVRAIVLEMPRSYVIQGALEDLYLRDVRYVREEAKPAKPHQRFIPQAPRSARRGRR